MTEIDLIVDLHKDTVRQGPGSPEDTLKAIRLTGLQANKDLQIADIGCGSGGQTITLAQNLSGKIRAVDLFQPFLDKLIQNVRNLGLENRIQAMKSNMEELPFAKESLDLIWSEGAIYNMGFERGIASWKQYLKQGGILAVSEISWTTESRPAEIEEFWHSEYPEIGTASNKIRVLEQYGYSLLGHFFLPTESWTENYFKPLAEKFPAFLGRHDHSAQARSIVEAHQAEMDLYDRFGKYFSYGFYVARSSQ